MRIPLLAFALAALLFSRSYTRADEFTPEPGFISLFNGHDLSGWHYEGGEPFTDKTESSDGRYSAKDGIFTVNRPKDLPRKVQQIWTVQEFPKDFILKLEFRAEVNADSGIFLRKPQLQCRDYLVAGPYKELKQYKPQDWNLIEVTVKDNVARCTCNGEVLEEALKLPETGPIGLEGDRGQMEYRHLQLKELPAGGVAGQIEIESRFFELSEAAVRDLPVVGDWLRHEAPPSGRPPAALTKEQCDQFLRALNEVKGVDLISAPRVTTKSEQQATVEIIREFRYPTDWSPPEKDRPHWTPAKFATRNVGLTLEVEPSLHEDGTIGLRASPSCVELLGFVDHVTKKPVAEEKREPGASLLDRAMGSLSADAAATATERADPVFQVRESTVNVTCRPGQSMVFFLGDKSGLEPFKAPGAGRTLFAIVTARSVPAEGVPPAARAEAPAPPLLADGPPFAKAVPGKPGFVTSPFSPMAGYIDVRGFDRGVEVKDPYSGKPFRVP